MVFIIYFVEYFEYSPHCFYCILPDYKHSIHIKANTTMTTIATIKGVLVLEGLLEVLEEIQPF